jgi:hypothetical protein
METECQLTWNGIYVGNPEGYQDQRVPELKAGAAEWKLLLQLDTDDDRGWVWVMSARCISGGVSPMPSGEISAK